MACPAGYELDDDDDFFCQPESDEDEEYTPMTQIVKNQSGTSSSTQVNNRKKVVPKPLRQKLESITQASKSTNLQHPKGAVKSLVLPNDMMRACMRGNVLAIMDGLQKGVGVDSLAPSGWTPLMYAAQAGQTECVKVLVEAGADVNFHKDKFTVLMAACSCIKGTEEEIKRCVDSLISAKAEVNAEDQQLMTPLMYAAKRGRIAVVTSLLEAGANINHLDSRGYSPLMWAIEELHAGVVEQLLQAGADAEKTSSNGLSLIDIAKGSGDSKIVEVFHRFYPLTAASSQDTSQQDNQKVDLPDKQLFNDKLSQAEQSVTQISDTSGTVTFSEPNDLAEVTSPEVQSNSPTVDNSGTVTFSDSSIFAETANPKNVSSTGQEQSSFFERNMIKNSVQTSALEDETESLAVNAYNELEVFLSGLQLTHLIPLFKENLVSFESLLRMTDDDLKELGVSQYGPRKRISEAILYVHKKEWKAGSFPKVDRNKSIRCAEALQVLNNLKKHLVLLASSTGFIKDQIAADKTILTHSRADESRLLLDISEDATCCTRDLLLELEGIQSTVQEAFRKPETNLPAHIILPESTSSKKKHMPFFGISTGLAVVIGTICFTYRYFSR